jgi:Ca2+-binding RTX toxin-like protein
MPLLPAALDAVTGGTAGDAPPRFAGAQTISGTDGADVAYGSAHGDRIDLKGGNDSAEGGWGQDTLNGGSGQDSLAGNEGADSLDGGYADRAADRIEGGDGDDVLRWSALNGNDSFEGGAGLDTIQVLDVEMQDILAGLVLSNMQVSPVFADGAVIFVDRITGQPVAISGELHIDGAVLRFSEVERFVIGSSEPDRHPV